MKRAATLAAGFVFFLLIGFSATASADLCLYMGSPGGDCYIPGDHIQCYDVDESEKLADHPVVTLNDQFGYREGVEVSRKVDKLCVAVNKNNEGVNDPSQFWACYKIDEERLRQEVVEYNQFGEQTLELKKSELLCVPSERITD